MKKEKLEHLNFFGLYTWLALVSVCLFLYFFRPDLFAPQNIQRFFSDNLISGLFVYFIISTLRGFTLIPDRSGRRPGVSAAAAVAGQSDGRLYVFGDCLFHGSPVSL